MVMLKPITVAPKEASPSSDELLRRDRIAKLDTAERFSLMGCLHDREVDDLLDRIESKKALEKETMR
jgi:hypothetical protein